MDTKKRLLAATIVVGLAGLLGVGPRENRACEHEGGAESIPVHV